MVGSGVAYAALAFVLGIVRPDVPYPTASRLISVNGEERFDLEVAEEIAGALRDRSDLFDRVVLYKDNFAVRIEGDPSMPTALVGSWDLFETVGLRAAVGRLFSADEDLPGGGGSIILSDRAWRTRFASDPQIVGQSVVLEGFDVSDVYTIVGVLAPGNRFPIGGGNIDFYLPRGNRYGTELMQNASILGRIAVGRDAGEAESFFESVAPRIEASLAGDTQQLTLRLYSGPDMVGQTRMLLIGLMAAAALALAVSALNVAMLSWLAALQRAQGFAVRLALGADRWRVRAALIGQSLAPVALGCALGIAVASILFARLGSTVSDDLVWLVPKSSWLVVLAAIAIYAVCGGLGALWPVRRVFRLDVNAVLRRDPGSHSGIDERRLRPIVVTQVSVVAALLMLGTLFAAAVDRYVAEDRGFVVADRTFAAVRLRDDSTPDEISASIQTLLEDPALKNVGAAVGDPPLPGEILPFPSMLRSSATATPLIGRTWLAMVSASYPMSLGVQIVRGRFFTAQEAALGARVTVLDTATVRAMGLSEPIVGQTIDIRLGATWQPVEVIGLVESLRLFDARTREPVRQAYLPYALQPPRTFRIMVSASMSATPLSAVERLLPGATVARAESLESMYRSNALLQLLASRSLRACAALALVLALAGLFAVLTQATERRRREFGIRIAVGAGASSVARLALSSGMKLAISGLTIGTTAATLAGSVARSALLGVPAWDLRSMGVTSAVILGTTALALVHPAISATRSDPVELMRSE
jgi:putative ABC transport system permease protein